MPEAEREPMFAYPANVNRLSAVVNFDVAVAIIMTEARA